LGWPTRLRALALTALTAEKVLFFACFFGISFTPTRCYWICAGDGYKFARFDADLRVGGDRRLTTKVAFVALPM
jgi:hypothetical protein